ncbi:MAG: hypothetical protein OSB41_07950 [Kiritimatiellae bacterium]|nr:hypothetical protein [Kiritimatiellia bacterium]
MTYSTPVRPCQVAASAKDAVAAIQGHLKEGTRFYKHLEELGLIYL